MDEHKPPIPSRERDLQPAPDGTSIVVESPAAPSVVDFCGNAGEVRRGFLIALRVMGVTAVEQPPEPARLPVARAKS